MADNLVSRIYESFRGVDFRGEEINLSRSPDCLNVWKDYTETESIRTRPKMEIAFPQITDDLTSSTIFDETVYGIYFFDYEYKNGEKITKYLVHSGRKLYECKVTGTISTPLGIKFNWSKTELALDKALPERRCQAFICKNNWYLLTGDGYYMYESDGSTGRIVNVKGYVPTTSIARKPEGGGTIKEDFNLITGRRRNTFLSDGTSTQYYLDVQSLDTKDENGNEAPVIVKVNGNTVSNYTVDYSKGCITFDSAPPKPLTDGQDNVSIEFQKNNIESFRKIRECTIVETFDNRVFFSGNPYHPNTVWHCSLNDPTYISDLDYYNEGLDMARVKSMVASNNALWVFREPSTANTSVFYHTPTIDSEYGKIYPSEHSSIAIGCVGGAINFNDDIVFFSQNGMEGINGDITTEQAVAHRSSLIDSKLSTSNGYDNMMLVEWQGYLIVIMGKKGFLADSRAKFTNNDHYEYEWFYWEFDKEVTCATVYDGQLYLGAENGVYTLSDYEGAVESYWVTPKDKFKYPQYQKTTNKRGCVVEATGDLSVSVKTDKTDFELIGEYTDIEDYFVSRIKRKKFKDIQLKFHSGTRFSLETATLECFIGGYIKR